MSQYLKREVPLVVILVVGLAVTVNYFIDIPILGQFNSEILRWQQIISATMVGLGIVNLFIIHTRRVQRRTAGQWPFSIWLMFLMVFSIALGFYEGLPWGQPVLETTYFSWFYIQVYTGLTITIFSLFGFYVVSATIHAFQIRNLESALLTIGAILIFLWNAPIGGAIWKGFLPLGTWISSNIAGSTFRGVTICAAVGIISLAIRIIFGMERAWMGMED